jgi:hypothetical protein
VGSIAMSPAEISSPRDVVTTVKYIVPGSKNQRYFSNGIEVNTGQYVDTPVVIHDARTEREKYTLDTAGFTLVEHTSKVLALHSRLSVRSLICGIGNFSRQYTRKKFSN